MQKFLGIDVGGTHIKCGIVTMNGEILHQIKFRTSELQVLDSFVDGFTKIVKDLLLEFTDVRQVGIGVPGTLNKARTHTEELPNVPQLNHVNLLERLQGALPGVSFRLENDANAAALGEYHFSGQPMPEDFIFLTMGTGIGGAAILDRTIFKGGDGNGMEVGHIMSEGGKRLEEHIGKKGILNMVSEGLLRHKEKSLMYGLELINTKVLVDSASQDDLLAKEVFKNTGRLLGEGLVSIIRVLDIKNIYIGGGISASFDFVYPSLMEALTTHLTPYYTSALSVKKAVLGNEAGILGAASLCFDNTLQQRET
ncbi:ROK family protein [Nafulsella turpanensis]|uniref:ROK family protein n=1 Tax=Nafulsella turpanensis TaxID=1265690 RepID=UPI00034B197E|nr:ROK family protein [Nafulsella turpanensis]